MVSSIPIYDALGSVVGDEKAKTIVDSIEIKIEETIKDKQLGLAKASQIEELKTLISETNKENIKWTISVFMAGFLAIVGLVVGLYFNG